ncbi:hypothetical protein RGQ15_11520 [Paracoccus sp. MBLB3053]|uniref:Uncharacterized protein n=1 Tax=Paracoccus aurantius TaxID=3073814 RepID=A0ABU2HUI5_9RHOB|nr:hypothetical protein [Paracoccus sp. MBLB3053]MDS9468195.1 hypothetical protein [Paracoccus sp. MBLB3053]
MALGYGAKADMVNPDAIDRVGALVFQTFGAGHELTREMDHFIDTVMSAAGRPEVWSEAGDRLLRAVERTTWSGAEKRADLDG